MFSLAVFATFLVATTQGLKCNEGFNISVGGIPFYHMAERECTDKSDCFSQELETAVVYLPKFKILARYSGCISSSYSSVITCENLFGPTSTLDPAVLFNMLPGLENKYRALVQDFMKNITGELQVLFSNGKGSKSFIAGCYTFLENLGFNMEKARPLQDNFVELFESIFDEPQRRNYTYMETYNDYERGYTPNPAIVAFLKKLGELDTANYDFESYIYTFIGNFVPDSQIADIDQSIYAPLVERLPGLIKAILPTSWKADSWYDFILEMIGNLNFKTPAKSATDVINTMKKYVKIPEEYNKFLDPVFDSIPDLVSGMTGRPDGIMYVPDWSLQLLKAESTVNAQTNRLSTALAKLFTDISGMKPDANMHMFLTWIPGLFYNLLEDYESDIDKAYETISSGIEAMDFSNPNATLEETKMSDFILMMFDKTGFAFPISQGIPSTRPAVPPQLPVHPSGFPLPPYTYVYPPTGPMPAITPIPFLGPVPTPAKEIADMKAKNKLLIVNLCRILYNLVPDYNENIDAIFTTLKDGFRNWPRFNAGRIIRNLFGDVGLDVPAVITPILDNMQSILDAALRPEPNTNFDEIVKEVLLKIVSDYKTKYPDSQLPDVFQDLIVSVYEMAAEEPHYTCDSFFADGWDVDVDWDAYSRCSNQYYQKRGWYDRFYAERLNNISIDFQFAVFNEINFDTSPLFQALVDAFPDYGIYIRLMSALDANDVKELMKNYMKFLMGEMPSKEPEEGSGDSSYYYPSRTPPTLTYFVNALNATIERITPKITAITQDLRSLFAPDSCKYYSCNNDLCNTEKGIITQVPVTRDPNKRKFLEINLPRRPTKATETTTTTTSGTDGIQSSLLLLLAAFWATKKIFV